MFTARGGMKGDGMSWGAVCCPLHTHTCVNTAISLQAHTDRLQSQQAFV